MTTGAGPKPWWNGLGFGLGMAFVVATLVILYAPAAPVPEDGVVPTTSTAPGPTITLDELQAMLTDSPGEAPPTVQVETPEGPVTVVVPSTSVPPTTSTTSTTTTPPPTSVPRPPTTVPTPGSILDDLLGREETPTTTIPEGAGGET